MATRTSENWACLPGGFDALNCDILFHSDNVYGIPAMLPFTGNVPRSMVPFKQRLRGDYPLDEIATHFFVDDYHFESLWKQPSRTPETVLSAGCTLTPDFSTYTDWPFAAQLWNVYRSRWIGAYWQSVGLHVIPTVTWSDAMSYQFCFAGIPQGNVVAVSSVGVSDNPLFIAGYKAMASILTPSMVLCYGDMPNSISGLCPYTEYSTRWRDIHLSSMKG